MGIDPNSYDFHSKGAINYLNDFVITFFKLSKKRSNV